MRSCPTAGSRAARLPDHSGLLRIQHPIQSYHFVNSRELAPIKAGFPRTAAFTLGGSVTSQRLLRS